MRGRKMEIKIGEIFGCYEILEELPKRGDFPMVKIKCNLCGNISNQYFYNVRRRRYPVCRNCQWDKHRFEIGEKIGYLTIIDRKNEKYCGKHVMIYICKCDCGKVLKRLGIHLKYKGRKKPLSCGCSRITYCNDLSGYHFKSIEEGAHRRGYEFNITKEYIWDLYLKQNKKCYYSGLDIKLERKRKFQTASLDRIDNTKGYIEGNVCWCYKRINIMKHTMTEQEFLYFCHAISEYQLKKLQNNDDGEPFDIDLPKQELKQKIMGIA